MFNFGGFASVIDSLFRSVGLRGRTDTPTTLPTGQARLWFDTATSKPKLRYGGTTYDLGETTPGSGTVELQATSPGTKQIGNLHIGGVTNGDGIADVRVVRLDTYQPGLTTGSYVELSAAGDATGNLQIAIPALAPDSTLMAAALAGAGAGNVDNGTHVYACAFGIGGIFTEIVGTTTVVTVTDKTVNGQVSLTSIPISTSARVNQRRIYRSLAGTTSPLKKVADIGDNVTTIFTDNVADASLTTNAETVNNTLLTQLTLAEDGSATPRGDLIVASSPQAFVRWVSRSRISSASNGVLLFTNNAQSSFTQIQLGGTTSSFPAVRVSGATIVFRLADNSADALIKSLDSQVSSSDLTAATMTMAAADKSLSRLVSTKVTWTNAMITALGAVTSGDITVCTLPAKTVVINAYLVVDTSAAGPTTVTMSIGRTGALYVDYLGNSDIKAAANTVYGDAVGERGANLTGYDLPSYTGTTAVVAHLISTVGNLDTVTGSTGTIILETAKLP